MKSTVRNRYIWFNGFLIFLICIFAPAVMDGLDDTKIIPDAYLTKYSETKTIEYAFEQYFGNTEWSYYESEQGKYVIFIGDFMTIDQTSLRLPFKSWATVLQFNLLPQTGKKCLNPS